MAGGTVDYTSPGTYEWEIPFAATSVVATAIGGGGGGYRDCTDDDEGGGGGGGGFARATRTITPGEILRIKVGDGGSTTTCNSRSGLTGGDSFVKYSNGNPIVNAYGGEGGTDDAGGGGGGTGDGDINNRGQSGEDDDAGGKGGGAGNQNNDSGRCDGSRAGGRGTNLDGTRGSCGSGKNGGNYGGGGGGSGDGETPGAGAKGAVRLVYTFAEPIIDYFTVTPVQDSGTDGIPNDNVTFTWGTQYANDIKITFSGGTVATGLAATNTLPYNTGLQSVAGSNSPAQRTYTLTAKGPGGEVTATATTSVYNDNCPNTFTIPDQLGKEPGQEIIITTSPISGIDMVTTVVCGPGVQVQGSGGSGYTTSTTIINGSTLNLRMFAEPFNTDENGLVNEKEVYVTVGCLTVKWKVQTRAPIVNELFDFGDNQFAYPFPKIDTRTVGEILPDGGTYQNPTAYLNSPTIVEPTVGAWQVELEKPFGVQIKAKDIRYSPPTSTSYTNISSQNDTKLEVNVQRQGDQPNNTWTKPNIS